MKKIFCIMFVICFVFMSACSTAGKLSGSETLPNDTATNNDSDTTKETTADTDEELINTNKAPVPEGMKRIEYGYKEVVTDFYDWSKTKETDIRFTIDIPEYAVPEVSEWEYNPSYLRFNEELVMYLRYLEFDAAGFYVGDDFVMDESLYDKVNAILGVTGYADYCDAFVGKTLTGYEYVKYESVNSEDYWAHVYVKLFDEYIIGIKFWDKAENHLYLQKCIDSVFAGKMNSDTKETKDPIEGTENSEQEDNKTDELIHGITPVEYMNKDNISEYHNLTEDQKIAFEFLITVHKDIIENGPVANKTYSLPRRMEWLDYKTAKNLFETNFTALLGISYPLQCLESQGTRKYVDSIYLYDVDERDEEYHREFLSLDARANDILSEIEHDGTEYGKALAIAKWMTDNIDYAHDYQSRGEDNLGTAYTALMTGEAICDGYAEAYDFLCKKAGLETIYVMIFHPDFAHAWNMIRIDEKWYHVDVTWMDTDENEFWMNFMMPDEVCYSNGHMKPEYFWDQKNNVIITPTADSYDLHRRSYESFEKMTEVFEEELDLMSIEREKMCYVAFPTMSNDEIMAHRGNLIKTKNGNSFYMRIEEVNAPVYSITFVKKLQ